MGRLFSALLSKNTLKAALNQKAERVPPFRKAVPTLKNRYRIVGIFWTIGIPTTLLEFYLLHGVVDREKKFYYKKIRDELREKGY